MNELSPANAVPAHWTDPTLSVVVPVRNEAENILPLIAETKAALPGFAKRRSYDAMLLGALTHRAGVTAQVGTLTSKLVDALECDFILVKPSAYCCPGARSCARIPCACFFRSAGASAALVTASSSGIASAFFR